MLGAFVACYMDNIIVFSKTLAEHKCHVLMVLATLRPHHQLFAKRAECAFLGHILSAEGLGADLQKLGSVQPVLVRRRPPLPGVGHLLQQHGGQIQQAGCPPLGAHGPPRGVSLGRAGAGELQQPQVCPLSCSGPPAVGAGAHH